MNKAQAKKVFPAYYDNFKMPPEAKEQELTVYRACETRKLERESFLDSYEANGFQVPANFEPTDPIVYSMSTYLKLRDVKRFVVTNSKHQPPFALAKGITDPIHGICCETRQWKEGYPNSSSHVDFWLYKDAEPWRSFALVDYEDEKRISQSQHEKCSK